MRPESYIFLGLAGFGQVMADFTQWMTTTWTETAWQTKAAETLWNTEWSTTTCWSTETPPTITVTITSEYEKDYTATEVYTEVSTIEVPYTTTSIVEKDFTTTIYKSIESEVTSVETVYTTLPPNTITKFSISTVISTVTVTEACVTPTLTGIVLCPSRITNEQGYVPPTPLPSTYLWGCPPGELCKPKQIDCNFERDLYAPTYICAPEDCIVAEQPPPLDQFGGPYANDYNSTCPFFETFDHYPLLNPSIFGLSYSEFAAPSLGITATDCAPPTPAPPPPPPVTTTTTSYVPPPPPPPVTTTTSFVPPPPETSTTQWAEWTPSSKTYSPWSSPAPGSWGEWTVSSEAYSPWSSPIPVSSSSKSWADWVRSSSSAATYSQSWDEWSATTAWTHAPGFTPRALARREDLIVPAICQQECQNCAVEGAYVAKVYSKLCPTSVPFQVALTACKSCITANKHDQPRQVQVIITELNQFLDVCSSGPHTTTTVSAPPLNASPSTTSKTTSSSSTPVTMTTTPPQPTTTSIPSTTSTTSTVVSSVTTTTQGNSSATVSIASYTHSGAAQPTQGPAAAMIVGVVVVMAMV